MRYMYNNMPVSASCFIPSIRQHGADAAAVPYANVAGVSILNRTNIQHATNLRDAMATAMYADQDADKERRCMVVSGLLPSKDANDRAYYHFFDDSVCWSFASMIDQPITRTYTRRLGAVVGDRVRPLLVGPQSSDDALTILSRATSNPHSRFSSTET